MSESRIGNYIETYTAEKFYPMDPRAEEIHLEDIAHALALTNRFSGHTRKPYSVAEHSVRVSWAVFDAIENKLLARVYALWGLLHDAPEAYLNDLPRPLKQHPDFSFYRLLETNLLYYVARRFGLKGEMPQIVLDADDMLLATEARDLMTPGTLDRWTPFRFPPQGDVIVPMRWQESERLFLERFAELTG